MNTAESMMTTTTMMEILEIAVRLQRERDEARAELALLRRLPDFSVSDDVFGITPDGEVWSIEPHIGHVEDDPCLALANLWHRWEASSGDERAERRSEYDAGRGVDR